MDFEGYKLFYSMGYLDDTDISKATKWEVLTREQYKEITGLDYQ